MRPPTCKYCDEPLVDVNEWLSGLRFGAVEYECVNKECKASPYYVNVENSHCTASENKQNEAAPQ